MGKSNNQTVVVKNLIWRYAERCGAQLIQFVVQLILARLLTPAEFGMIGLLTVFVSLALVFAQSGMGQALVQKKDSDQTDFSTVFYFSIVFSVAIYIGLCFAAPYLAKFYDKPLLVDVIRVLSVMVIIGGVNSVQQAYVQKHMQFKLFFYSTLSGTIVSAVVGITMAYMGFGIWALVTQQIVNQLVGTIVLFFTVKWRPSMHFSFKRMGQLFSFGWKMLCSSLLDTLYNNIYSLVIGKRYSDADLGYYNKGKQFPMLIVQNINTTITSVLFPVLSKVQDEKERLKSMMRRSIVTSTFLIFPAMAGLAAIAEPLVKILLTDKWLPAVPFIQFCCFTYAFWPIHTANLQAIKALGRSDIFLGLEIAKKIIGIVILIITLPYGLTVMMIGRCVATLSSSFINAFPNRKLLGYSYFEQIKDIFPSMLISIIMVAVILPVTSLPIHAIWQMCLQIICGVAVYVGLAKLFKLECFEYILNTIKNFISKRKVK